MRSPQKSRALFLDRDGVINIDTNYVYKIEEITFLEGIFDLTRTANEKNYKIIIITNQAGIGRGYYTEDDFAKVTKHIEDEFARNGGVITKTYYCPNHPEFGIGKYKIDCKDRKPAPGMIHRAEKEHHLDLSNSIIIGDRESDIEAGINAGIKTKILLPHDNFKNRESKADYVISSLAEAIKYL